MSIQPVLQNVFKQLNRQRRELDELHRRVGFSPVHAANAKEYTIDVGAIDVTRPNALLHPESGTADDLDTINNAVDGKTILLRIANASYSITVRHDVGNIWIHGSNNNRVLNNIHDSLWLVYSASTGYWEEISPLTLDALHKVIISNPQGGQFLGYDPVNQDWKNIDLSTATQEVLSEGGVGKALELWNGTSNDPPPAGWQQIGFDDSTWGPTVQVTGGRTIPPGSERVWHTDRGTSAIEGEEGLIRHKFVPDIGPISDANLEIFCDDEAVGVWINDTFITDDVNDGTSFSTHSVDPNILLPGEDNVLAIHGKDLAGGWVFVAYRLIISGLGGVSELNDLNDVTITTPADKQQLVFDAGSGQWINSLSAVLRDGTQELTANWDIGDGRRILGDGVRARDADGIRFEDAAGGLGLFVADGGNVGFGGITSPDAPLHGTGTLDTAIVLLENRRWFGAKNSGGTAMRLIGMNGVDDIYLGAVDNAGGKVIIREDGNDVITLSGEKVGFGAPDPVSKVHAKSDNFGEHLIIDRTGAAFSSRLWGLTVSTGGGPEHLRFYSVDPDGSSNRTDHVVIQNDGTVGIGTTDPSKKVEISDGTGTDLTIALKLHKPVNGSGVATGLGFSPVNSGQMKGGIFFQNDGTGSGRGNMYFCLQNTNDSTEVSINDAVLTLTRVGDVNIANQLYFGSNTGDVISLYANRLGSSTMYGFGVETTGGQIYYKGAFGHHWYVGDNADLGTSAKMKLSASYLTPHVGLGEAWNAPSFNTGWENASITYYDVGYRKFGDMVMLRGRIQVTSGSASTTAFTLPSAYRPSKRVIVPSGSSDIITIESNGNVVIGFSAAGESFSLDGIWFSI